LVADEIEIAPSAAAATVPVWNGLAADGAISISSATNKYYRKVKVSNLM
jgi:hypothetical protein